MALRDDDHSGRKRKGFPFARSITHPRLVLDRRDNGDQVDGHVASSLSSRSSTAINDDFPDASSPPLVAVMSSFFVDDIGEISLANYALFAWAQGRNHSVTLPMEIVTSTSRLVATALKSRASNMIGM